MPNKIVLDSCFVSALFNNADELHAEAVNLTFDIEPTAHIIVPSTVLLELSLFGKGQNFNTELTSFCNHLISEVVPVDQHFTEGFNTFVNLNSTLNLKTVDYSILYTAISTKSKLLTFDDKLKKAYQKFLRN